MSMHNEGTVRGEQIAKMVREAREAKGLTQGELAAACEVHKQTIGNLERATVKSSPELLAKVESVLGIELSAAALTARDAVGLVTQSLQRRLGELSDADGLALVGDALLAVGMDGSSRASTDPGDDMVEFVIEGNFGVRAVVKGPVRDLEALREAASQMMRDLVANGAATAAGSGVEVVE